MKKGKKLYEGKAKIIFASNDKKYMNAHEKKFYKYLCNHF